MAVVLAIGTAAAVLVRSTGPSPHPTPPVPAPSAATAPSTTLPAPRPPYAVGTLTLTVSEPATATVGARSFTTFVRYPALAGTGSSGGPAPPLRASAPFPLVVFSGGYAVSPEGYSILLDAWAAAGFVVADPVEPFTTPSSPQGLDEGDIVHHPGDVAAVITALVGADQGAAGPAGPTLAGVIDTGRIAAIGHSDGGDVTLASVADPCCRDPRIRAAVVLSGAEDTVFGGTYFSAVPAVPLLVVQGTDDAVNPVGCSVQLYDQAPPPKYYLSLTGQTHQGPYLAAGPALTTVERVTIDFLDGELADSAPSLAALPTDGTVPGLSSLTSASSAGLPTGSCPGAPPG